MTPQIILLALGSAFIMGYALNQGSTCAVTAAKEWIDQRRGRMAIGFAIAVAVAGLTWIFLAWLGGTVTLSGGRPVTASLLLGAVLLGVGALINDACLLGTLSRIGHGELRFLALPSGLALGFLLADLLVPVQASLPISNPLSEPSLAGVICILALVAVGLTGVRTMRRGGDDGDVYRWSLWSAMMVLGFTGAILFALAPGWTYAEFVHRGVSFHANMATASSLPAISAAFAMVTGAICAGIVGRTYVYQTPSLSGVARSVMGGVVMAVGIVLVPGGNDTVLLAELPVLTTSGLVGFAVMSGTVTGLLWMQRRWFQQTEGRSAS